jgi:hypothetical protein
MALVDDLFTELNNKNILFEIDKDPEDNRIFIVKTQSTLLAIGVEVEDEINSSKLPFGNLKNDYLERLHDFYFQLAEPLNGISKDPKKDGKLSFIFFFISKNYIVLDPDFWGEWICYEPEDNLNKFFIELSNHPELRTEEQKKEDEIDELKSNVYSLEQKVLKYTNTNEKLEQSLSYMRNSKETLEKENKEMEYQMYSENIIKENLQKEVEYLKNIVKSKTISRLSDKQIEYLKNRGGFPVRIELELLFPSLIMEFNNFTYRNWGTSGDAMPVPVTEFLEINEYGKPSELTLELLTNVPNFPGFISEKDTMIVHLIGSISITMEDFDITT